MTDIARIAFVTRHFEELKGLRIALYGAGLLFGSLLLLTAAASDTVTPSPFMGILVANMLLSFGSSELEPRYRNTFGNAVNSGRASTSVNIPLALRSFGIVTVFAMTLGPLADITFVDRSGPSIAAVAIAAASLLIVVRDWRWRIHYLVPAFSGIAAAIMTAGVAPTPGIDPFTADPHRTPVLLVGYSLIGVGLITGGLLDHRLLATTLQRAHPHEERPAWRRTRPFHVALATLTALGGAAAFTSVAPRYVAVTLTLLVTLTASLTMFFFAISVLAQRARGTWKSPYGEHGFLLSVGGRDVGIMLMMAIAASIDATIVPGARPLTTALAFSACHLAVVVRDPRRSFHYLVGAVAGAAVLVFLPRFAPSQSFALFVCAAAGSLAIEWGIDLITEMKHAHAI